MQRPTTIMVFGILNLVLAGLGLFSGCFELFSPLLLKQTNPELAKLYTGTFLVVSLTLLLFGTLSKGMMLASGVGLVKGQEWGRRWGVIWAWFSMALGVVVLVVSVVYIVPVTIEAMKIDMQNQTPNAPQQMLDMIEISTWVSTVIGGLITAFPYQITFLILMNRKPVKDYLAGGGGEEQVEAPASDAAPTDPW